MTYCTVLIDGIRHAGLLRHDVVAVDPRPGGLDAALAAGGRLRQGREIDAADAVFDAPLRPPVVFCVGQNYADHLDEKAPVHRPEPEFFLKAGQTIAAPGDPAILDPRVTAKLDYETELGIVIGRPGRAIDVRRALDHVAGYVALNDLTARDRQVVIHPDGSHSFALGPAKNFDGSTRMGPTMVPSDELDIADLTLTTTVDGELRQQNSTANLISSIPEIVAFVSTLLTLQAGAVIATGTPGGTGWGTDPDLGGTGRTPPGLVPASYLQPGQFVEGRIGDRLTCSFHVQAAVGEHRTDR